MIRIGLHAPAALECRGETERAARAGCALDGDAAAHATHDRGRDRQPEPCTTVPPRRGSVGLSEGFEDGRMLVGGNANACVFHCQTDSARSRPVTVFTS